MTSSSDGLKTGGFRGQSSESRNLLEALDKHFSDVDRGAELERLRLTAAEEKILVQGATINQLWRAVLGKGHDLRTFADHYEYCMKYHLVNMENPEREAALLSVVPQEIFDRIPSKFVLDKQIFDLAVNEECARKSKAREQYSTDIPGSLVRVEDNSSIAGNPHILPYLQQAFNYEVLNQQQSELPRRSTTPDSTESPFGGHSSFQVSQYPFRYPLQQCNTAQQHNAAQQRKLPQQQKSRPQSMYARFPVEYANDVEYADSGDKNSTAQPIDQHSDMNNFAKLQYDGEEDDRAQDRGVRERHVHYSAFPATKSGLPRSATSRRLRSPTPPTPLTEEEDIMVRTVIPRLTLTGPPDEPRLKRKLKGMFRRRKLDEE